ncbi:UPF0161 protein [Raphanus sativus]|uniref:UPF0161 protein At3g09310 isoform X1 n=1 Tax=Raphanus sativus TaxID=3726 RepID=A0A6J0P3N9_RAPSA|nr:UPF0161 protein At3g09310 isoform X1 [Raphanus sativus]KAJ4893206.1 UPF0161 protein [Raphanus sativus]
MAVVVVSVHRPYATHLISENPNPPKIHLKFSTSRLSFHHLSHTNKHQLRCLSAKSTPSSPDPESPKDGEEQESVGVKVALAMLRFYKREISPVLPRSCRYVPTCSEYSMEAYKRYGVLKGTVLTTWRLCRCNPFGGSGYDPPRWFGEGLIMPQEEEEEDGYGNENEREI